MEQTEKTYSPKDLQLDLEISDSTLRKWALALENEGYTFLRTEYNRRLFTTHDHIVLNHFKHLVKIQNMSLQNASAIVTSKFKSDQPQETVREIDGSNTELVLRSPEEFNDSILEKIVTIEKQQERALELINEQKDEIKTLIDARSSVLLEEIKNENRKFIDELIIENNKLKEELEENKKKKGFFGLFKS